MCHDAQLKAVLAKVGLHPGAAGAAVDTMVWLAADDEIVRERVVLLVRLLQSGGVVQMALEGAIQELQRYVGVEAPVLETAAMKCGCEKKCVGGKVLKCPTSCGWDGSWVGMLLGSWQRSTTELRLSVSS